MTDDQKQYVVVQVDARDETSEGDGGGDGVGENVGEESGSEFWQSFIDYFGICEGKGKKIRIVVPSRIKPDRKSFFFHYLQV